MTVANVHAYTAQDAPAQVDLEVIYDLAAFALALLMERVILHRGGHALSGAVADAHHAAGAIGFSHDLVPGQRREPHEAGSHR